MELPKSHDRPEFVKAWQDWLDYRKKRRLAKYATDRVLINLLRYPVEVAIQAIEGSLSNEYQGLFPQKYGCENVARDQRLGKHIQQRGRASAAPGKYDHLDTEGVMQVGGADGADGGCEG